MTRPFGARLMAALVLLACAGPVAAQTMCADFLDVGQGSTAIIDTECAAVLIDTGGELNNEFDTQSQAGRTNDLNSAPRVVVCHGIRREISASNRRGER